MYSFVNNSEVKKYKSQCADMLNQLKNFLKSCSIKAKVDLIGSGAKNLVTQNEDEPFDLDYNLVIASMPSKYCRDPKKLKDTVRDNLNQIVKNTQFSDGRDSTSAITSILRSTKQPSTRFRLVSCFAVQQNIPFKFDLGIICKNARGNYCKLVQDKAHLYKDTEQFIWNEVPDSRDVGKKAKELKQTEHWAEVRESYLNKKNMYLRRQDRDHPPFIVYAEAVNEVYYNLNKKRKN